MKQLLLLLLTIITFSVNAQVDWNAYKDPGGKFYRLQVEPDISFGDDFGNIVVVPGENSRLDIPVSFTANVVKEKSVLRISSFQGFYYTYDSDETPPGVGTDYFFIQNLF